MILLKSQVGREDTTMRKVATYIDRDIAENLMFYTYNICVCVYIRVIINILCCIR